MTNQLWIAMVVLGACARLLPHPWNFTPLIAMALFAGVQAKKATTGALSIVVTLALGDAIMGFHPGYWYVYAAALLPVFLGRLIRGRDGGDQHIGPIALTALASSLSFAVITNFMVWATSSLYPHTVAGLTTCFVAAIPFYRNQLVGDAVYTVAIFGGFALFRRLLQPTPQAA